MRVVHKVCTMLRRHETLRDYRCKECPAWELLHGHKVQQGCRMKAEEMVNIVKFGNPWGRKYRNSRRSWPDKK